MRIQVILASLIALAIQVNALNPCDLISSYSSGHLTTIVIDGKQSRLTKLNTQTTLAELRKCAYLKIEKSMYFFSKTKLIEQSMETKVTIASILAEDVIQEGFNQQKTVYTLVLKTAPAVSIMVFSKVTTIYIFEEVSLTEIRYQLNMGMSQQFYINGYSIDIKSESVIYFSDVFYGGEFLVEKITTDSSKTITKETLSTAVETVSISIRIEESFSKTVKIRSTTTIRELRTQLSLNASQFFFRSGCLVYYSNEQTTKVSEVATSVQNGTSAGFTIQIKNAPKLALVVNGVSKTVYAFSEASLKDLRVMANLDSSLLFYFQSLAVSTFEEEFILIREISISSKITVMSLAYFQSSGSYVVPRPNPVPVPPPVKPVLPLTPPKVPLGGQNVSGSGSNGSVSMNGSSSSGGSIGGSSSIGSSMGSSSEFGFTSSGSSSSNISSSSSQSSSSSMSSSVEENKSYNSAIVGKIGISGADVKLDSFGNPVGAQFDLVKDGALNTSVLVYDNHGGIGTLVASVGLQQKGITFVATSKEQELLEKLANFDELWIIPCQDKLKDATVKAIQAYVKGGKGVWIFGGNQNQPSNQILAEMKLGISFVASSAVTGTVLTAGNATAKGQFGAHPITTGLNKFDMFDAKCQISGDFSSSKGYSVIATGNDGLPLVVALEDASGGRFIFDCYRERLFDAKRILQSARYLKNGAAWLAFSEGKATPRALLAYNETEAASSQSYVGVSSLAIIMLGICVLMYYRRYVGSKEQKDLEFGSTTSNSLYHQLWKKERIQV